MYHTEKREEKACSFFIRAAGECIVLMSKRALRPRGLFALLASLAFCWETHTRTLEQNYGFAFLEVL